MYQHGGDIYSNSNMTDFSANINFLGMPESVKQAAMSAIEMSVHYPDVQCRELKTAIADCEGVSTEHIFCGNGAADVIFALVQAHRPKRALLPVPSFYEYQQALASVDCEIQTWQMYKEQGFCLGYNFLEQITASIDIIFLCNPNNPTGVLTEPKLIEAILQKCQETGTLLVVDECFLDFVEKYDSYTMVPSVRNHQQLVILKAFTKMYAMPGLRLGYCLSSNSVLIGRMEQVSQPWRVSVPAQAAGVAALKEQEFVKRSRIEIRIQRLWMMERMGELGFQLFDSTANFVFFKGKENLPDRLKEKGFLIRDCGNYIGLEQGYYRVAVRGQEDNQKLMQAMEECNE